MKEKRKRKMNTTFNPNVTFEGEIHTINFKDIY
jgi:hypothetical protein